MDEYLTEQHRRTISQLGRLWPFRFTALSDGELVYRDDSEGTIRKYYKGNYRGRLVLSSWRK